MNLLYFIVAAVGINVLNYSLYTSICKSTKDVSVNTDKILSKDVSVNTEKILVESNVQTENSLINKAIETMKLDYNNTKIQTENNLVNKAIETVKLNYNDTQIQTGDSLPITPIYQNHLENSLELINTQVAPSITLDIPSTSNYWGPLQPSIQSSPIDSFGGIIETSDFIKNYRRDPINAEYFSNIKDWTTNIDKSSMVGHSNLITQGPKTIESEINNLKKVIDILNSNEVNLPSSISRINSIEAPRTAFTCEKGVQTLPIESKTDLTLSLIGHDNLFFI